MKPIKIWTMCPTLENQVGMKLNARLYSELYAEIQAWLQGQIFDAAELIDDNPYFIPEYT